MSVTQSTAPPPTPWTPKWFEWIVHSVAPNSRLELGRSGTTLHLTVRVGGLSWWKRKRIEKLLRDRILEAGDRPVGVGCRIEVRR